MVRSFRGFKVRTAHTKISCDRKSIPESVPSREALGRRWLRRSLELVQADFGAGRREHEERLQDQPRREAEQV